jgi:4-diphosphocytidyl-2-C-methyl-D-erythritol kinase
LTHTVRANAKVNLHLEVLSKRSDSYHNIFSLNASLDLFDRLTFKELNIFKNNSGDIFIEIHPDGGEFANLISSIPAEENLINKAVKSYLSRIGKSGEISISVEKNIPAGAGFGGGSSDAAAALKLLNDYFIQSGEGLPEHELSGLAAGLGADVPYCLAGGFAFCEGIGEILEKIEGNLKFCILTANCGISVNTAKAYRALNRSADELHTESEIKDKKALFREGIQKGNINIFKHILKNDFELPVFSEYPELGEIKKIISGYGPEYVTMTGSGSSIIGLFKDKAKALDAKKGLEHKAKVLITEFL